MVYISLPIYLNFIVLKIHLINNPESKIDKNSTVFH